jgi:hypothetical protein
VNEEQSLPSTVYHTNIKGATQQINYEEDGTATKQNHHGKIH